MLVDLWLVGVLLTEHLLVLLNGLLCLWHALCAATTPRDAAVRPLLRLSLDHVVDVLGEDLRYVLRHHMALLDEVIVEQVFRTALETQQVRHLVRLSHGRLGDRLTSTRRHPPHNA